MLSTAAAFIGLPAKATIKIDHMQPGKALPLESQRLRAGIIVEHGRLRHIALLQAQRIGPFLRSMAG